MRNSERQHEQNCRRNDMATKGCKAVQKFSRENEDNLKKNRTETEDKKWLNKEAK